MSDSHSETPQEPEGTHLFDSAGTVRRLILVFFVVCALLVIGDLLYHRHLSFADGVNPVEGWFGFYAIYGFIAYVMIVLGSIPLRKLMMRSEDYYDG